MKIQLCMDLKIQSRDSYQLIDQLLAISYALAKSVIGSAPLAFHTENYLLISWQSASFIGGGQVEIAIVRCVVSLQHGFLYRCVTKV